MKKYQIFISSTYMDLVSERAAVEEAIMRGGDIPVGMEAFPAVDQEQFEFIKSIILQCDYYILIIAARYGSLADDGISYTEKEFDFAVDNGIPVIFMLHGKREGIAGQFVEKDAAKIEKLESFIKRASTGRIRNEFLTVEELKYKVITSLTSSKQIKPRPGWVRGVGAEPTELLGKIVALQEENSKLKSEKPKTYNIQNIAGLDQRISLKTTYRYKLSGLAGYTNGNKVVETTLGEIFAVISPYLDQSNTSSTVSSLIARLLIKRHASSLNASSEKVDEDQLQTIKLQFQALGLTKKTGGAQWVITPDGEAEMMRLRVLVSDNTDSASI